MVYSNGKIYRIICQETNRQYIGSTCNPLRKRLYQHKLKGHHCMTKDFINPIIVLIEDFPCERKEQLLMRERHFIETMDCVNKMRPIISREELLERDRLKSKVYYRENTELVKEMRKEYYHNNKDKAKEYYEKNKDEILNKKKEYREKNKEMLRKKRREKYAAAKELKNISK